MQEELEKNQVLIRNHYSFIPEIENYANDIIDKIHKKYHNKAVVAVHMRKGDYKTWRNGEFYYSDNEYLMRMVSLARKSNDLHFHIISNEIVDKTKIEAALSGLSTYSTSSGNQYQDLAVLSKADYIIGPQSTYSAMAAFLGDVPLYFMERDCTEIALSDFSWQDRFRKVFNGKKL